MRARPARFPIPFLALVSALALVASACGDDDQGAAPDGETTTTSAAGTTTTGGDATTTTSAAVELTRCANTEGFSIGYPESWVQMECSMFHREPFEDPGATDERVAAITAYVDPVDFDVATDPESARNLERTELTLAGHRAMRLSYEFGEESALYPPGTPITYYAIELRRGDGRSETLFVDTVGLPSFAYEENVDILDRMAPTLEIPG